MTQNQLTNSLNHNSVTVFLYSAKVSLSHRSQTSSNATNEFERGLVEAHFSTLRLPPQTTWPSKPSSFGILLEITNIFVSNAIHFFVVSKKILIEWDCVYLLQIQHWLAQLPSKPIYYCGSLGIKIITQPLNVVAKKFHILLSKDNYIAKTSFYRQHLNRSTINQF